MKDPAHAKWGLRQTYIITVVKILVSNTVIIKTYMCFANANLIYENCRQNK